MSTTRKQAEHRNRNAKKDGKSDHVDEEILDMSEPEDNMVPLLEELRNFRREHADASRDTKAALTRVETTLKEVIDRTEKLERQMNDTQQRVSDSEDKLQRHKQSILHLLQREEKLTTKCEELASRARRNNVRIYGTKEGEEKNGMISLITGMLRTSLNLPLELELSIERAHRSLMLKPRDSAPPRSIIIKFLDYRVKERVLRTAWQSGGVSFQGQRIFFDQDYTADVQNKRKQVRAVIKQLKEKKLKAVSPFPAQLKIFYEGEPKTFSTLA